MARIIHIDDNPEFRKKIRQSLAGISGLELIQAEDLEAFYRMASCETDLYITDRHFPEKPGANVADLWASVVSYASEMRNIYHNKGVIVVSDHPPAEKEWRRYSDVILNVMKKSDFNTVSFREMVESLFVG